MKHINNLLNYSMLVVGFFVILSCSSTLTTSSSVAGKSPTLNKTTAIRILLGEKGLGSETDAKNYLTPQEIKDIRDIRNLYAEIKSYNKPKRNREIDGIITDLKSGKISISAARSKLQDILIEVI